jgi:hypothetical protein
MKNTTIAKLGLLGASAGAACMLAVGPADAHGGFHVFGVPDANPRIGVENNVLTPSAHQVPVAWGNLALTNPDAANGVTHYGYNTANGGPLTQASNEANKTEPDKNVYLVFGGKHYLYQGHEGGPRGYVTRINLDETDPPKRVTLISDVDADGNAYPTIDGLTWDPFTHQLLLTAEAKSPKGGVLAVTLDGNVWLVEDIGGSNASGGKVPNSYVYRFVPTDKADLSAGGTL